MSIVTRLSALPATAAWCCVLAGSPVAAAAAATLNVGPQQPFATVAAAIAAAADGDTIAVQAGTYTNDYAEIAKTLTFQAIGGRVAMRSTGEIPNGKGILVIDTDVTITGFTFYGARVPYSAGQNGAGIRYQGGNLTLEGCDFHDNQEGLLATPITPGTGTITIQDSEFARNGDTRGPGMGYTHNLYVGNVAQLTVENGYFHDANIGHELKSRALATTIDSTRVVDGPTGTASYSIDLPNGGAASITNSQIEQGPLSQNPVMVSYGEEGNLLPGSMLTIRSTLLENDLQNTPVFGLVNSAPAPAVLADTQVFGLDSTDLAWGPVTETGTMWLATEPAISTAHPY